MRKKTKLSHMQCCLEVLFQVQRKFATAAMCVFLSSVSISILHLSFLFLFLLPHRTWRNFKKWKIYFEFGFNFWKLKQTLIIQKEKFSLSIIEDSSLRKALSVITKITILSLIVAGLCYNEMFDHVFMANVWLQPQCFHMIKWQRYERDHQRRWYITMINLKRFEQG